MRVASHPCYILHQRPYRETSLLLEVLSSEHGRVGLVARGVKRPKSQYQGLLQPFQRLMLAWSGRGELGALVSAEREGPVPVMTGGRLIAAFYLNELILRMLHRHEPHPDIFAAYERALRELALSGDVQTEVPLRIFEKRLLQAVGYGLVLERDVLSGQPLYGDQDYYYSADRGPSLEPLTASETVQVSGATLQALAREDLSGEEQLRDAKRLLRFVLQRHLGGRPLASRTLYRALMDNGD
jgi:DNA repair protein RecO (recombination protein O)